VIVACAATPSDPVGMLGTRTIEAPVSVCPYPSVSLQSNRSANRSKSISEPSLPNPRRSGLSRSSAFSGVAKIYVNGLPT